MLANIEAGQVGKIDAHLIGATVSLTYDRLFAPHADHVTEGVGRGLKVLKLPARRSEKFHG